MKKDFLLQGCLLAAALLPVLPGLAQTNIFSENMGTSGAGANPAITVFTGFQNSGCSYMFSGTGDVRNSTPSSGSGVNNVYLTTNRTLIISGINTLGFSGIGLSYGLYSSGILSTSSGLIVEASTNGSSYTVVAKPSTLYVLPGWLTETVTGALPATQNLFLRFTNNSGGLDYRLDDLLLTGTPTASTNPTAYNGWPAAYTFNNWPAGSAAGTYPANMIFHYATPGVAQPVLNNINASYNYVNSYSISTQNTCISLISGQGSNGVSFVDRNPGSVDATGNLGEAVLALNTTCRANIQVAWTAGTLANNGTVYQLRAQYRIGSTGSYTNLPNTTVADIRYTSATPVTNFGPITLPASCENVPLVQLRWAYYYAGSGSGTGDEIYLTNINVSSAAYPVVSGFSNQSVCGGKNTAAINFASSPAGATITWSNNNPATGLAAAGTGNIAAYTTPTVTSDKTSVITVLGALNSCTSTSSFSLTVKGPQAASTWNGSVSTDWFEHNNWSNCVCSSITNATIPVTANNPLISGSAAANVGTLTVNSGAGLVIQNTQTLNVAGNWINNGSFTAARGNVILNGSVAQSIGGSATSPFYNLTLNNSTGASLASAQQLTGSLQLNAGTFNTNNQLTLIANAAGTGKIGPINAAADIINNVTSQQYAAGGTTGWTMLGSPISPALTMADWNDNFAITCASCPNGSLNGFTSIYTYDETIAGSYSVAAKYIPITTISNSLSNGKGYWVYLGNGLPNTTAITIDVTGTVAKSSCLTCGAPISLPVSKTNNTSLFDDGWNLLANPLPSPISWTALRNGNASIDNALYVYNPDLAGGLGAFATFINGVSSTTLGGITDTIPIGQGFYVHAIASTNLVAGENTKVNGNPALLRTAAAKPIARLVLSGANAFSDMTTFYFESGGTPQFQADYDAYKLIFDENTPYLGSMSDSLLTAVNGLPVLGTGITVPVKAITAARDSFCFSLTTSDFPANACVALYDAYTGISTDLLSSSYCCQLYDTTRAARFSISFSGCVDSIFTAMSVPSGIKNLPPFEKSFALLSPGATAEYELVATFDSPQSFDAALYDAGGKLLKRYTAPDVKEKTLGIPLSNYAPGVYYLRVSSSGRPEKVFKLVH